MTTVTQNLEMEYANTFQINLSPADNKVPDIKEEYHLRTRGN